MLTIRNATREDIPIIQQLSHVIWWATYDKILSRDQIGYMLDMMYSSKALNDQIAQGHKFLLCYDGDVAVGFASYSRLHESVFKLHKIYVLPRQQGKGVGKFIIARVFEEIRPLGATALELNVNRHNPAKDFYERLGFKIVREEDIDIGSGYWMNDYVMRKEVQQP